VFRGNDVLVRLRALLAHQSSNSYFSSRLAHQASNSLFLCTSGASGVEFVFVFLYVWCIRRRIRHVLCNFWCIRRRIRYFCIMGVPPKGSMVMICNVINYRRLGVCNRETPTGKSDSVRLRLRCVRACVRASEAACACETMLFRIAGVWNRNSAPACVRARVRALAVSDDVDWSVLNKAKQC
jgi:hypothetical protein